MPKSEPVLPNQQDPPGNQRQRQRPSIPPRRFTTITSATTTTAARSTSRKRPPTDGIKSQPPKSVPPIHNNQDEPRVFFGEYWEIEKVLAVRERVAWIDTKHKRQKRSGKNRIYKGQKVLEFLIQWKGSQYENSWEPEEHLCDSALQEAKVLMEERAQMKRREKLGLRKLSTAAASSLPPSIKDTTAVLTTDTAAAMTTTKTTTKAAARPGMEEEEEDEGDDDSSSFGGISFLTASILDENDQGLMDEQMMMTMIQQVVAERLKHDDDDEDDRNEHPEHRERHWCDPHLVEDRNFNWDSTLKTMEIERISVLDPKCSEKVTMSRSMGVPIVLTDHKGFPQFASRWLSLVVVPSEQPEPDMNHIEPSEPVPNQQHGPPQYESMLSYDSIVTLATATGERTSDDKAIVTLTTTTTTTAEKKSEDKARGDQDDVQSVASSEYCKVLCSDNNLKPPPTNPNPYTVKNDSNGPHNSDAKDNSNGIIDLTTSNDAHDIDDVITIASSIDEVNINNSEKPGLVSDDFISVDLEVLDRQKNDADVVDQINMARRLDTKRTHLPKLGESTADADTDSDWVISVYKDDSNKKLADTTASLEKRLDEQTDNNDPMMMTTVESVAEYPVAPLGVIENGNIIPMLDLTLQYTVDVAKMIEDIGDEAVPILRKKYDDSNPINSHMAVRRFLRDCWPNKKALFSDTNVAFSSTPGSRKFSSLYMHQWLFTASPTAVPKLCNQVNLLPFDILGEDLLRYWYNQERCAGDSPYQYIFMGDTGTMSRLHKDNGGLDILIAPIVGQKEVKLVHRADGVTSLYNLDACIECPDFDRFPMLYSARIWKSVIHPGEILVMPEGTYHQCRNISPCLSYHRFHLDTLNLKAFYESWNEKDAPDIDHEEVIWNAATELCTKVDTFVESIRQFKDPKPIEDHFVPVEILSAVGSLHALRNICREISAKLIESKDGKHWKQLVQDVEVTLHEFRYRLCQEIPAMTW